MELLGKKMKAAIRSLISIRLHRLRIQEVVLATGIHLNNSLLETKGQMQRLKKVEMREPPKEKMVVMLVKDKGKKAVHQREARPKTP